MNYLHLCLLLGARRAGLEQDFHPVTWPPNTITDGKLSLTFQPELAESQEPVLAELNDVFGYGMSVDAALCQMYEKMDKQDAFEDFCDRIDQAVEAANKRNPRHAEPELPVDLRRPLHT